MKTLSLDLRLRVLAAVDEGVSQSEAARRLRVSRSSVKRLLKQRSTQGHVNPKPRPGVTPRIAASQHEVLANQMRAYPDETLEQHAQRWQEEQQSAVSSATVRRTLRRMNWSYKKRA